jgi:hypothetical protein
LALHDALGELRKEHTEQSRAREDHPAGSALDAPEDHGAARPTGAPRTIDLGSRASIGAI